MEFKPYLSIDIETTSINPEDGVILEVAMIYDDLKSPLEELKSFQFLVKNNDPIKGDHFALQMNYKIIQEICGAIELEDPNNRQVYEWETATYLFHQFVKKLAIDEDGKTQKLTVAGKNVAGFDIPWLKHHTFNTTLFQHRVLDPGPMYLEDFGYVPNLSEIKKFIRLDEEVNHRAYDDALDVIKVVRYKLGVDYE